LYVVDVLLGSVLIFVEIVLVVWDVDDMLLFVCVGSGWLIGLVVVKFWIGKLEGDGFKVCKVFVLFKVVFKKWVQCEFD